MNYIKSELNKIIESDGGWSAHNIQLGENLFTMGDKLVNDELKLPRVIQNISDFTKKPFSELRILDLACLEGMFGIETAMHGAKVTLLDGRDQNITKSTFVKDVLELKNVDVVKDDVRNISPEKYGVFDVILCFGIFYHLDKNDLYDFVQRMYDTTTDIVMIDTHITSSKNESFVAGGHTFYGEGYREHHIKATEEEKQSDLWKSLDNDFSFYLTKESLVRMLTAVGFTSVVESYSPADTTKTKYRVSITAFKGKTQQIKSTPFANNLSPDLIKERDFSKERYDGFIKMKNSILYKIKMYTPKTIKEFYKKRFKGKNYK
jgi:predicted RNA methylase